MRLLGRFDAALLRVEHVVVAMVLAVMGSVVFLDVVTRSVAGKGPAFWAACLVIGAVAGALAGRSRKTPVAAPVSAAAGVAAAAALCALPLAFPNGLIWSQPLALALTLWLGTIGASIAAYERRHLALDIGAKLWPARFAPIAAGIGHLVTAVFCVVLLGLAWRSMFGFELDGQHVPGHVEVWTSSDHAAGNLSGTDIPRWVAVASILYGMLVLAFRFTVEAVRLFMGLEATGGDDTLRMLGIAGPDEAT